MPQNCLERFNVPELFCRARIDYATSDAAGTEHLTFCSFSLPHTVGVNIDP